MTVLGICLSACLRYGGIRLASEQGGKGRCAASTDGVVQSGVLLTRALRSVPVVLHMADSGGASCVLPARLLVLRVLLAAICGRRRYCPGCLRPGCCCARWWDACCVMRLAMLMIADMCLKQACFIAEAMTQCSYIFMLY
jgi:hypothetical protein